MLWVLVEADITSIHNKRFWENLRKIIKETCCLPFAGFQATYTKNWEKNSSENKRKPGKSSKKIQKFKNQKFLQGDMLFLRQPFLIIQLLTDWVHLADRFFFPAVICRNHFDAQANLDCASQLLNHILSKEMSPKPPLIFFFFLLFFCKNTADRKHIY